MKRSASFSLFVAAFALLSMLVSSCAQPSGADAPAEAVSQHNAMGTQVAYSVEVSNKSASEFVNFTLNLADQTQQFYGSAPQTDIQVPTGAPIVGVMANGVNIPMGVATVIAMTDGKKVTVTWSDGVIAVNDTLEMN